MTRSHTPYQISPHSEVPNRNFEVLTDDGQHSIADFDTLEHAESFVHALNAHDELVRCLEYAVSDLEACSIHAAKGASGDFTIGMFRRMRDYREALAKANNKAVA